MISLAGLWHTSAAAIRTGFQFSSQTALLGTAATTNERRNLVDVIWQQARSGSFSSSATLFAGITGTGAFDKMTKPLPYEVPLWAKDTLIKPPRSGRLRIGNFPTPVHSIDSRQFCGPMKLLHELNVQFLVKRDDMSGGPELGGNKIRKLEFLLADALSQESDCVVTIGGEQSNHCRATASAARLVGLDPHLILRTKKATYEEEGAGDAKLGLVGNVMFDRIVGSTIHTCTPGEYGRFGQAALVEQVCESLRKEGRSPYAIPVGGSNPLGTWGYIEGVRELEEQLATMDDAGVDHVVFATGSGGTLSGIVLGLVLAHLHRGEPETRPQIHAVGVCDDPDYFYGMLASIAEGMGLRIPSCSSSPGVDTAALRDWVHLYQGKGMGYAVSTDDEMTFIKEFARDTGIVLDPVYSGKAMYNFFQQAMLAEPEKFRGSKLLFWHTGGSLGIYDRDMMEDLKDVSPVTRLDAYGKRDQE